MDKKKFKSTLWDDIIRKKLYERNCVLENTTNKRIWKLRTTLKCKQKKKPNREPDKHKALAAARGDTLDDP